MCQADRPEEEPEQVLNSEIEDNPLYHEQIENKPFPPMIPVEQTQ
jgi:hypothetical protein